MVYSRNRSALMISVSLVVLALASHYKARAATDDAKPEIAAKDAFARLKSLVGTWTNQTDEAAGHEHDETGKVTYRLTGAGSALVETDLPGTNHEMVSVYFVDGDDLRMTHYCAVGNQPRLKLDKAQSTPDRLVFVFDGGTNLDPAKDMHIHGLVLTFLNEGKVDAAWESHADGKPAGSMTFHLSPEKR